MRNPEHSHLQRAQHSAERSARVERLLFAGTAFGTAISLEGTAASPKLPPFVGE